MKFGRVPIFILLGIAVLLIYFVLITVLYTSAPELAILTTPFVAVIFGLVSGFLIGVGIEHRIVDQMIAKLRNHLEKEKVGSELLKSYALGYIPVDALDRVVVSSVPSEVIRYFYPSVKERE
ncbi:MAG: hypothetical protein DRJ40_08145 [Thermoprotei archaeon]|nr:MAG: hypothetical protein DRJ40_08145 [Thermoprotei archaeon]